LAYQLALQIKETYSLPAKSKEEIKNKTIRKIEVQEENK
jgi:predicted RNA binding protein YcfA (HicA-like mRNA interferase family)